MKYSLQFQAQLSKSTYDLKKGEKEEEQQKKFIKELKDNLKTIEICDINWFGADPKPKLNCKFETHHKTENLAYLSSYILIRFNELTQQVEEDLKTIMSILVSHTEFEIVMILNVRLSENLVNVSNEHHIDIDTYKTFEVYMATIKEFNNSLEIIKGELEK